jgi:hypothetical protein
MARLFADENFPMPGVVALRRLGHDVVTMSDAGLAGQAVSDEAVLRHTTEESRALLTLNRRHFIRLHQEQPEHAGIIVCTVDADAAGQAERIHQAITGQGDLSGALLRVNRPDR